jgi:hypothetical protein
MGKRDVCAALIEIFGINLPCSVVCGKTRKRRIHADGIWIMRKLGEEIKSKQEDWKSDKGESGEIHGLV